MIPGLDLMRCARLIAFCCTLAANAALAQTPQPVQPVEGQAGKDVVWIPSPRDMVEKMLEMARVTPQDYVIDLGSGDGRNVIAAARRGARALGVEYNPDLVAVSRRAAAAAGVADKAAFVQGDMYEADISQATVLILFLLPDSLARLSGKFRDLKPGTRIVSNTYEVSGWYADETGRTTPCPSWCIASLYVVPAKVAGTWRLPDGELTLRQDMQSASGAFELDGISLTVENGWLRGNEISFSLNGVAYSGRVNGDTMEGTAKGRTTRAWHAIRLP
ncbi:MAG: methyltransferase domain-containing protein [Betaproteobacteria bacterium]|nr:methyltransferase domain-containing protein [Betaproteobacteria bacterium]MBI2224459.1 methyltransferase domain-containing protein [Betaproteobacteria bacterium]MBI2290130.1 methyltransferase domain-containing protein [Betaproteobacteria bacterium]MBI3055460.1 methyltransferase domain-containing protein [Betaproteobacteria bacterium]